MLRRFVVRRGERALLTRDGEFVAILHGGVRWYFDPLRRLAIEIFSLDQSRFDHPIAQRLPRDVIVYEFHTVSVGPQEVGLRYENGVLVEVLPPDAQRWYWRCKRDQRFVVLDIRHDLAVARSLVPLLAHESDETPDASAVAGAEGVLTVRVPERHTGLLMIDDKVAKRLDPGLHAFWRFGRPMRVDLVDWSKQETNCAGGEEAAAA